MSVIAVRLKRSAPLSIRSARSTSSRSASRIAICRSAPAHPPRAARRRDRAATAPSRTRPPRFFESTRTPAGCRREVSPFGASGDETTPQRSEPLEREQRPGNSCNASMPSVRATSRASRNLESRSGCCSSSTVSSSVLVLAERLADGVQLTTCTVEIGDAVSSAVVAKSTTLPLLRMNQRGRRGHVPEQAHRAFRRSQSRPRHDFRPRTATRAPR